MKKLTITAKNHIFFIGIGGISMSGLANLMVKIGKKVSGSDLVLSSITKNLETLGAVVYQGHHASNLEPDVDLVVYTGAIPPNNEELLQAEERQILTMERSEFLGQICTLFKNVISVAGTHGKTTTTAMIGQIFLQAGLNPTIHVGGEVVGSWGNFHVGGNEVFITEACEYKKSLEHLHSTISVVTNMEPDHMDCYNNFEELVHTFQVFTDQTKQTLFTNHTGMQLLTHTNKQWVQEVGGQWCAKNVTFLQGKPSFEVYHKGEYWGFVALKVMGKYQVTNALFAIAVANEFGILKQNILQALNDFLGVKRRNEHMGTYQGVPVFADYAHHPEQVKQSIAAFQKIYKKVLVVFQPHTYSRTRTLKKEFVHCFRGANKLILYRTYPAREEYQQGGDVTDLFSFIAYPKRKKTLAMNLNELESALQKNTKGNQAIVFMGAGNLYDDIPNLLKTSSK